MAEDQTWDTWGGTDPWTRARADETAYATFPGAGAAGAAEPSVTINEDGDGGSAAVASGDSEADAGSWDNWSGWSGSWGWPGWNGSRSSWGSGGEAWKGREKVLAPSFSGEKEDAKAPGTGPKSYLRKIEAWEQLTEVPPLERAIALYYKL